MNHNYDDLPAVLNAQNPAAVRGNFFRVGDHQDQLAFNGNVPDHVQDDIGRFRVQGTSWLIGDNHVWVVDQSPGNPPISHSAHT